MTAAKQREQLAWHVRQSAEAVFGCRLLKDKCSVLSYVFWRLAARRGLYVELWGGVFVVAEPRPAKLEFGNLQHIALSRNPVDCIPHAWNGDGKQFIDLTATQFDPSYPSVMTIQINDERYRSRHRWDGMRIALKILGPDTTRDAATLLRYARRYD